MKLIIKKSTIYPGWLVYMVNPTNTKEGLAVRICPNYLSARRVFHAWRHYSDQLMLEEHWYVTRNWPRENLKIAL